MGQDEIERIDVSGPLLDIRMCIVESKEIHTACDESVCDLDLVNCNECIRMVERITGRAVAANHSKSTGRTSGRPTHLCLNMRCQRTRTRTGQAELALFGSKSCSCVVDCRPGGIQTRTFSDSPGSRL